MFLGLGGTGLLELYDGGKLSVDRERDVTEGRFQRVIDW